MFYRKALLYAVALLATSFSLSAQDENLEDTGFSFGLNGGFDYNINAYKTSQDLINGYEYYGINEQWNIGADFGIVVSKKFRPRLELKYVHTAYGMKPLDATSIYDYIKTQVHYFDLNLHFDYLLIRTPKFHAYLSPAIKTEFETGVNSYTYRKNGSHASNTLPNLAQAKYPSSIAGAALGFQMKYDISNYAGITFSPEYTYFFHGFATGNSSPYMRVSANLGIEFAF